jgi:hypothetical protein
MDSVINLFNVGIVVLYFFKATTTFIYKNRALKALPISWLLK